MKEYFMQLDYWQVLLIILIILSYIFLVIIITKPYIKIGDKLIFGAGNKRIKKGTPPHANCPFNSDLRTIFVEALVSQSKIDRIELVFKLDEQMAFVEEKMAIIRSILVNNFSNILMKKIQNPLCVTSTLDYKNYSFLIETMLEKDIYVLIRSALKQNNLHKIKDEEFEYYIKGKIDFFRQSMEDFRNSHYDDRITVLLGEIKDSENKQTSSGDSINTQIIRNLEDILKRGRKIALEKAKEIEQCIKEYENKFSSITGISSL